MSDTTKIQWTDCTWSPWRGCAKVSPGCANCYIYGTAPLRIAKQKSGSPRIRSGKGYWAQPLRWNTEVAAHPDYRTKVFPSLCDWLDDEVPIQWLADFLKLIHDTPNLDWLLLTKRPENFFHRIDDAINSNPHEDFVCDWSDDIEQHVAPNNVWLGVSCENQEMADKRIPILLTIPAKVRFISAEPLLGPIDFESIGPNSRTHPGKHGCTGEFVCNSLTGEQPYYREDDGEPCVYYGEAIDWIIFGGESGPLARPCHVSWIRDGLKQCQDASVPAFVKQLGSNPTNEVATAFGVPLKFADKKGGDISEWHEQFQVRQFPRV